VGAKQAHVSVIPAKVIYKRYQTNVEGLSRVSHRIKTLTRRDPRPEKSLRHQSRSSVLYPESLADGPSFSEKTLALDTARKGWTVCKTLIGTSALNQIFVSLASIILTAAPAQTSWQIHPSASLFLRRIRHKLPRLSLPCALLYRKNRGGTHWLFGVMPCVYVT
jgi:hypothetical protein